MDGWCARNGRPRGEVLSLEQAWLLANAWYGNRLDPDFRGRSAAQAEDIFRRLGLRSPFWSLASAS